MQERKFRIPARAITLRGPVWRAAGVGKRQEDVVNLLVLEAVLHLLGVGQRQLPLAHGGFTDERRPASGVATAGAPELYSRESFGPKPLRPGEMAREMA
jgi:hypothetical protein